MIDHKTAKDFKWLPPEGKHRVWLAFMKWEKEARKREADIPFPIDDELNEREQELLEDLCEGAQDGFDTYWNQYSHPSTDDNRRTTDEQPTATDEQPKEEKERIKEKEKNETKESESPPAHIDGFSPPSIEDVRQYAAANSLRDDAEKFVTYYEAHNWLYKSGQLLTNWQAGYRMWLQREEQLQSGSLKKVLAQDYKQREYNEKKMAALLGVDDLYKEES